MIDPEEMQIRHVYRVTWDVREPEALYVKDGLLPYIVALMTRNTRGRSHLVFSSRVMNVRCWNSPRMRWRHQLSPYLVSTIHEEMGPLPDALALPAVLGRDAAGNRITPTRDQAAEDLIRIQRLERFMDHVYLYGYKPACSMTDEWQPTFTETNP